MNLKLFLICTLSSFVLLGCPATNDDEDINEIPPKENNETVDAGNDETQNPTVDAGSSNVTEQPDAGSDPTIVTADAGEVDICTLPAETGPCEAEVPRFYFNSSTGQCESFTYGGCYGNANNFETIQACEAACGTSTNVDAGNGNTTEAPDAGTTTETTDGGTQAALPWDFTSFGGCGFVYIHGKNTENTVGLHFDDGDLNSAVAAYESSDAGIAFTTVFNLATDPDRLRIEEGANITHESCNDAFFLTVTIDRTWRPVSGTATLTVTSDGEATTWGEYPAGAVLILENVVLSPTDDATVTKTIESLTIEVSVGWMPG